MNPQLFTSGQESTPPAGPPRAPAEHNPSYPAAPDSAPFGAHDEFGTPSDTGERSGRIFTLVALCMVVAIGAGGLWLMRGIAKGHTLEDIEDPTIDYPLDKAQTDSIENRDQVLRDLSTSADFPRLPLGQVQMNPFTLKIETSSPEESAEMSDPAAIARREAEKRRREIEERFAMLKLNSVMNGSVPMAQISGSLVRVGDTVDELFTVKRITGRSVTLKAEGESYTLSMNADQ